MIDLIKGLVMPSHVAAFLFLIALVLALMVKHRRKAFVAFMAGAIVYLVFSNGVVATALIGPLENRYPPFDYSTSTRGIRDVVVLTAFATADERMPLSSRAGSSTLYRVMEVVNLFDRMDLERVYISGDEIAGNVMVDLLVVAGVPRESIALDPNSMNTSQSPGHLVAELGQTEFYLVTSAGHLPRAMGVFKKRGLSPVPVPTDFQLPQDPLSASWEPGPFHLQVSDLAVHEYLGLLWYRITGRTDSYW